MAKFPQEDGPGLSWIAARRRRPRARFWSTNVGEALGAVLILGLIGLAFVTFP